MNGMLIVLTPIDSKKKICQVTKLNISQKRNMTNRIEKVNSLLEQEIGKVISRDFNFGSNLVTLTHVDTTANLIEARAYVSVFPDDKTDAIIKLLNKGVYDIQQKINRKLNMRPIPKIIFRHDKEIVGASRVEEILSQLKKGKV
jgi:ribosome-binding factor A